MDFTIRATTVHDSHYLIDIDLKCFEHPWSPDQWREVSQTCTGLVATVNDTPVAMAISRRTVDGDMEIVRIGVKEACRRQGISRALIGNLLLNAKDTMANRLLMVVPERSLQPGQPDDLSQWLTKLMFRANKPMIPNHFYHYGEWEDGVIFSLAIPFD